MSRFFTKKYPIHDTHKKNIDSFKRLKCYLLITVSSLEQLVKTAKFPNEISNQKAVFHKSTLTRSRNMYVVFGEELELDHEVAHLFSLPLCIHMFSRQ